MTQELFNTLAVGIILAVILFAAFVMAYKQGLRLGITTAKGEIPKPYKNPVKAAIDAIEDHAEKKKEEEVKETFGDMMSYTKESALKAMKIEKAKG